MDDDRARADHDDRTPLWPRAADAHSGLRPKASVEDSIESADGSAPVRVMPVYQPLSPMGYTAYGRAFRARHAGQGREVALHFLDIDESEARALPLAVAKCAQLSHGSVIALEDHGRDPKDGSFFLVTEPLEGVSLADELGDLHTLPLARALALTLQIGRALHAAHKLGIVHGALSPGNVRLVSQGDCEIARVVGFGCVAFQRDGAQHSRVRGVAGPYLAPECARGAVPDARSDVYALGSLLFRMLTGHPPEAGETSLAVSSQEPIPRELEELVSECLAERPEERVGPTLSVNRRLREIARSLADQSPSLVRAADTTMSLPPVELGPPEGDASGSLFGPEGPADRSGLPWVVAGLLLALAAVWVLWEATARFEARRAPRIDVPRIDAPRIDAPRIDAPKLEQPAP